MSDLSNGINYQRHEVDVCVVGGGIAGLAAALSAARHGARVALMHDRPVLGGNSSSEIRVHICGADRACTLPNLRETGILEELRLENLYRNPNNCFSVWDLILYEKARFQPNLTLLLNCTCQKAQMNGPVIVSLTGWQLTTETYHTVTANIFIDCSGDGILAPLTGAEHRMGREGRNEYGESIAPPKTDNCTMGMTCLFQTRKYPTPQPFTPPPWAYKFPFDSDIPYGDAHKKWWEMGYWWVELGGQQHSIHDTEACRDELLRISLGVWDHIKNQDDHGAENWALEWLQFLPGKRESRRYVSDHVLTQLDIESGGRFEDVVAYGGWPMDDHDPAGFWAVRSGKPATIFHPCPSPYGISYRCLCSRNVANLLFAGRCAGATHTAMSSTRVMGTGALMGQAAGLAAAFAAKRGLSPRQVGQQHIKELQQALLRDDCYLPGLPQEFSPRTTRASLKASRGNPQPLRDGVNRPVGGDEHCWVCSVGDWVQYDLGGPVRVNELTLVLDSMLDRLIMMSYHGNYDQLRQMPPAMPRSFRVDGLRQGQWTTLARHKDNRQRLVRLEVSGELESIRYVLEETWGAETSRIFAFYIN